MRFEVVIREENHRPVVRIGQLVRENGDGVRIANNAAEWHRRYRDFAKQANAETAAVVGGKKAYETMSGRMV